MHRTTVRKMAYTISTEQLRDYSTYRLERGTLFKRAGVPVVVIPQFKGVQIATHTVPVTAAAPQTITQTSLATFQAPTTPIVVQWKLR